MSPRFEGRVLFSPAVAASGGGSRNKRARGGANCFRRSKHRSITDTDTDIESHSDRESFMGHSHSKWQKAALCVCVCVCFSVCVLGLEVYLKASFHSKV